MQLPTAIIKLPTRRFRSLIIGTAIIIAAIVAANAIIIAQLHQTTLRETQNDLLRQSLVLAEVVERTYQSVDLALASVAEKTVLAVEPDGNIQQLTNEAYHVLLKETLSGLPQIDTLGFVDAEGFRLNHSRDWPSPKIDLSYREYFQAIKRDPKITSFVTQPMQGSASGAWVVVLARPVVTNNGELLGVVFASTFMKYFEELFRSTALGEGYAATLMRQDGKLLARYPVAGQIGTVVPATILKTVLQSRSGVSRSISPIDGQARIAAAHRVENYPLVVVATRNEAAAFASWRATAITMGLAACIMISIIIIAACLIGRSWKQQERLNKASAALVESDKIRTVAEAELVRRRAEYELDETKRFLHSIIANIPIAVVVKDARTRKIVLVNRAFETMLDLPESALVGTTVFDVYGNKSAEFVDEGDNETLRSSKGVNYSEYEVQTPTGGTRIHATNRIVIRDAQGNAKYLVAVIDDVTERRKAEQRISFMAHHDALTGLANRVAVMQKIEEAAARHRRSGDPFSVLLMDLDRFKNVNDTLGHSAGDALLREIAARLKTLLRETDVLARLGGDEFAIILVSETEQCGAASTLAKRIIEVIAKPVHLDRNEVNIGTSIGIALAPEHGTDPDSLLKMADMALYAAKSGGRNGYRFFDPDIGAAANARQELENELRHAIQQDELELYYQPIIDAKSQKISAAEALVRWRHPTKGTIFPDKFIPLAEETGLIAQICEWVLRTACSDAVCWPVDVKVAVNLSPVQFQNANVSDIVTSALAETGLPPQRLELEITETALLESKAECLPALTQFKNLGIAIALDDFGTGYSSLSHLTMFPFDKIKIDKSFTQNLTKRAECAAIISATLTLANSLNIATTAEGVETVEQCRLLRMAGVTSLQGYLFKRPCRVSEIDFDGTYGGAEIADAA